MDRIWIAAAALVAVAVVAVPFAAMVLVSIASRREEAAHSLSRQAPGGATRAARRLLGYRTEQSWHAHDFPAGFTRHQRTGRSGSDPLAFELMRAPAAVALAPSPALRGSGEVRFGHAGRPLSNAGQYPASGEPQPRSVRADERQGAGV